MEFVKGYIYSVCITLIVVSILSVIIPEGKLKGFTSAVLSVFVLFSFVSPIKNIDKSVSVPYLEETKIDSREDAYTSLVEANVISTLKSKGIDNAKASCKLNLKNDEISIKKISVVIDDSLDRDKVKKLLFDELGLNAEVYYIGE